MTGTTTASATIADDWRIDGMSCASCAGRVERALRKVPGVVDAQVNLAMERAHVTHAAEPGMADAIAQAVQRAGYGAVPVPAAGTARAESPDAAGPAIPEGAQVALGLALALPLVAPMLLEPFGMHAMLPPLLQAILASLVQFGLGARFYRGAWRALRTGTADMDVLVSLGTSAAWGLSMVEWARAAAAGAMPVLYFESAAVVIALVRLGKWLEARAKRRTLQALRSLDALRPAQARRRGFDGVERLVAVDTLAPGDTVVLLPGERCAVDGQVAEGASHVDESVLTGEPVPVARSTGELVRAGTLNGEGRLVLRVTAVGTETQVGRIVRLVESAQAGKAPVQQAVDRVSAVFVPVVLAVAVLAWVGSLLAGVSLDDAVLRAVSVLVIACPCALGLATPATLMVASGAAARRGLLVREAAALDRLRHVRVLAWDKTGTLTEGRPRLVAHVAAPGEEAARLADAARLQLASAHPLAKALATAAPDPGAPAEDARAVPGRGVEGRVDGRFLLLGSAAWLDALKADRGAFAEAAARWQDEGLTVSWLAEIEPISSPPPRVLAAFAFGDAPRPGAKAALDALSRDAGVRHVMLSGDNAGAVRHLAASLGLADARAGLTPGDKAAAIAALHDGLPAGATTGMVGDGVNDAPALAAADVGLAMADPHGGTDVAAHTAGLTILRGDPWGVVEALDLARATGRVLRQNLFWAFAFNAVGLPLAATGHLSPVLAGGAMALSSVLVVSNALRLARWRPPSPTQG